MPHRIFPVTLLGVLCASTLGGACQRADSSRDSRASSAIAAVAFDEPLTDRARVLAGLPPERDVARYAGVLAAPAWREWKGEFDTEWRQASASRFDPMTAWREQNLAAATGACDTLLYPFSGPDILNALLLFPSCQRYVLFGLEHTGSLPDLERLSAERLAGLLGETRRALGDLMTRNYAITRHMMKDMEARELHGNLPLLAVFLVRLGAQLISARQLEIAPSGRLEPAPRDRRGAPALEIVFAMPGRPPQSLVYFRALAQDTAIGDRPGVVPFLERQAPYVTFLKSASYLLHEKAFSVVRGLVVGRSRLILQDDSGVPLRYLSKNQWTLGFFGRYQRPVADFNYGYQPDLAQAYNTTTVKPLTFSFGYHWEAGSSTLMLATRTAEPASTTR